MRAAVYASRGARGIFDILHGPSFREWRYLLNRLDGLFHATGATGAVLFVGPEEGLQTVIIEVAGRRYYVLGKDLRFIRTEDDAGIALARRLLAAPDAFEYTPHGLKEPHPNRLPYKCPRCGCSLDRDKDTGKVWCTFVGGGSEAACTFGIDAPVELGDLLACPDFQARAPDKVSVTVSADPHQSPEELSRVIERGASMWPSTAPASGDPAVAALKDDRDGARS